MIKGRSRKKEEEEEKEELREGGVEGLAL